MTLPDERTRAVYYTRKFLLDLLNPKATPRVPKDIRRHARSLLRHYPSLFDLSLASKEVFGEIEESLDKKS